MLAAAIAARPPPAPPRPVGRPRLERPASFIERPVVWLQLLPLRQEEVAAEAAAQQAGAAM